MNSESNPVNNKTIVFSLLIYLLLIIYGTLFPLSEFQLISINWNQIYQELLTAQTSRADLITNALIYIPLGFLCFRLLSKKPWLGVIISTIIAISLSVTLEFTQLFLPSRTTAISDLVLNSAGGLVGAFIGLLTSGKSYTGQQLHLLKINLFNADRNTNIGLLIILFWSMSQLMPLVPSLDWGFIKDSLKPFLHLINQKIDFNYFRFSFYIFSFASIGIILSIILKRFKPILAIYAGLALLVLIAKIFIMTRQLSPEALSGFFVSFILITVLEQFSIRKKAAIGMAFILTSILAQELEPVRNAAFHSFSWIPFVAQMKNFTGAIDMLIGIWPFMCLAFFANIATKISVNTLFYGGLFCIVIFSATLEYLQMHIPGRYPDITDTIMAILGWGFYFSYIKIKDKKID